MFQTLIVDLDGTIVDCAARHYACYRRLVEESGQTPLDQQTYWRMKRARGSWSAILAASRASLDAAAFNARFVERIEHPALLALDHTFPGTQQALSGLRELCVRLLLVTMRRSAAGLAKQLDTLGLAGRFDEVVARGASMSDDKSELARRALCGAQGRGAWIGDTEEDLSGARRLGMLTCAVSSGMRERALLEAEGPDIVVNWLRDAPARLQTYANG